MTTGIINLPTTTKGRELLRSMLPFVRDGRLPDGMPIAGQDWDQLAIEGERDLEDYEAWCREQEGDLG